MSEKQRRPADQRIGEEGEREGTKTEISKILWS